MKAKDFDQLMARRFEKMQETMGSKASEYASDRDRLHNFKRAAALQNCTPERALLGMLAKHLVSVFDIIDKLDNDKKVTEASWDEKIGDTMNYLQLLDALYHERGFAK